MHQQRLFQKPSPSPCPSMPSQQDNDSWQYHYQKILSTLQGTPQQKQSTIRKRILRYFGQFKIQSQNYLSLRNDIDYSTPGLQLIPSKIILYGVDYMSVQRARAYFQGWMTIIRRMDDSHFFVEFRSQGECLAAVNRFGRAGVVFGSAAQMFAKSKNGWIQFKPYHEFIFQRKLMARYCTNLDQFPTNSSSSLSSTKQSYTLAYSQAKRRFMKSLRQDLQKYEFRKQNRGYNARGASRSRSKDGRGGGEGEGRGQGRDVHICGKDRSNIGRAYVGCSCRGGNRDRRDRRRNVSRSGERSDSLSSGYDPQDEYSRRKRYSRRLQQQKIKQADFKFQLYIKRRDQALNPSAAQGSSIAQLPSFASAPLFQSKDRTKHRQKQKSFSTTQQCFQVPSMPMHNSFKPAASIFQPSQTTSSNNSKIQIQSSSFNPQPHHCQNGQSKQNEMVLEQAEQMDFQMFLEKLKLEDSKGEYSAFDLDLIDGME